MKRKKITVHYTNFKPIDFTNVTIKEILVELFDSDRIPDKIVIDDEITLEWNPYKFMSFITLLDFDEELLLKSLSATI